VGGAMRRPRIRRKNRALANEKNVEKTFLPGSALNNQGGGTSLWLAGKKWRGMKLFARSPPKFRAGYR